MSRLRKELGDGRLVTRSPGYLLRVDRSELDLARFEQLVAEAGRADPRSAALKLRRALALWRGPPLAELAYEPFAQAEIVRLEELRWAALEQRIDADLAAGRHRGAGRRARGADRRASAPGALALSADARALPLGPAGRGARRVSPRQARAVRAARARAGRGVEAARAGDPEAGSGARTGRGGAGTVSREGDVGAGSIAADRRARPRRRRGARCARRRRWRRRSRRGSWSSPRSWRRPTSARRRRRSPSAGRRCWPTGSS